MCCCLFCLVAVTDLLALGNDSLQAWLLNRRDSFQPVYLEEVYTVRLLLQFKTLKECLGKACCVHLVLSLSQLFVAIF